MSDTDTVTARPPAKAPRSGAADRLERQRRPARPNRLVWLMGLEALTLAVFSALHLSGALRVGSGSGHSYGAGVAEALICLALAGGAWALARSSAGRSPAGRGLGRSRRVALSALGFAVFGFLVGLSFTVDSGDTIDLVYHLAMLPVLVTTVALIAIGPGSTVQNPRNST